MRQIKGLLKYSQPNIGKVDLEQNESRRISVEAGLENSQLRKHSGKYLQVLINKIKAGDPRNFHLQTGTFW